MAHVKATSDAPSAYFPSELIPAYPDAKIILTLRQHDSAASWLKSMVSTLWHQRMHLPPLPPPPPPEEQSTEHQQEGGKNVNSNTSSTMRRLGELSWTHVLAPASIVGGVDKFPQNGEQVYTLHNDGVRSLARAAGREILEWDASQSWGPLCEFLGTEIPRDERGGIRQFPRVDDWAGYKSSTAATPTAMVKE